jgi:hypothetical protein
MNIREKTLNDLDVKKTGFSVDRIDTSIPKPLPRTYNHFMLITAKPRQGKTTLMYSLLVYRKSPYYRKFDKVYVFSPSLGTADKDKLKKLAPEQKYKELTLEALEEVYGAIEGSGERILIIADDVVNDVKKNVGVEKMLCKMMMNRRHICGQAEDGEGAGLSMWMTTQVFNKMPRALRATADYYIMFKSSNKKELETLFDEVILLQKNEFEEMLKYVFHEKFNFLLIDTNEDFKNMYHKNLNKRLIFPHMEEEEEEE